MIQQTIFPRVNTHIAAISKSYQFNGGTATVQVDSLGNYEVMVNGSRFSTQENSAKRAADYKPAVSDISLKMVAAFEKRDAEFTAMHKKAARMQKLSEHQKKIDALFPQQYERESFPLSRPMREDVRRELEAEAEIRFSDLYEDKRKERITFVNEHEKEAMAARLRAYEEIQSFFSDLQDDKEARANALFQKEYDRQKKEIEAYINGERSVTERNIRMILGELSMPFRVEISCDYDDKSGLLNTDIEFHGDMNLPANKTNTLATGKISVKDKLVKEMEQFKTETIVSMIYYVAASLFNAAINISTQRVSVWLEGKREGLVWIQFDRAKFSKLSMRTVNPMLNYYDWPHVDALRMVRGASQFDTMDASSFRKAIAHMKVENGIRDVEPGVSSATSDTSMITVSVGDAKTVADALPNDVMLKSLVAEAVRSGATIVTLPTKYKGILKELSR
ncbi:MAG: hypothetical protein HDS70_03535 [Bacteroidales bacterium]|nr:hypothetical protein [Bacteroidales bacterium]